MTDSIQPPTIVNPGISARLVTAAENIRKARAELLEARQLQPGHDEFLFALLASDGVTMGSLAETLAISASSASKIAIKLETANLIRREASRVDSRQNFAHLTEAGTQAARDLLQEYDALEAAMLKKLKGKDSDRLLKILDRLENDGKASGKKPKKAGSKKPKTNKPKTGKSKTDRDKKPKKASKSA